MSKKVFIYLVSLFVFIQCARLESNQLKIKKNISATVIYGQDDRLDLYQVLDRNWKQLAFSTVALIGKNRIQFNEETKFYDIDSVHYGLSNSLCKNEPFYNQPSAAFCSGFLIGPDIIVTAGHCVRNQINCENTVFVFGFSYPNEIDNLNKIKKEDVYHCKELIHSQTNGLTGVDYAMIRLQEPVMNYAPLHIQKQNDVQDDAKLTVIGYPSGLPLKLADGGIVRDNSLPGYFVTTLDTYGGNSGSAVFNSVTRLVEGILVRGDTDFGYDQVNKCRKSNICNEESCRGEDVVRIQHVLDHVTPNDLMPL